MNREQMIELLKTKYPCLAVENEKLFPLGLLASMVATISGK